MKDKKKIIVFGFDHYYPRGGMNDFLFYAENESQAIEKIKDYNEKALISFDYYQIFNTENMICNTLNISKNTMKAKEIKQ